MSKIFLTGASGYIGGQVLRELTRAHPDYAITALVRGSADRISDAFPKVRTVVGDLDDVELVEREASQASVVLHLAANKHIKSVEAIHRGLAKRQPSDPAYWVQISGASGLAASELADNSFVPGSASPTVFDDLAGIGDIRDLVRAHRTSRTVDNYVLDVAAAQSPSSATIRAALVWPPIIYGAGEGPGNQRSYQVPTLARVALERGRPVKVGEGANRWGNIHVRDLGRLISGLVDAAVKGDQRPEVWGENGIYLTGVGELTFSEIAERIGRAAREQKLISSEEVEALDPSSADAVLPASKSLFGSNARGGANRSGEVLGWKPSEESLEEEIPRTVAEEAKLRAVE